MGLFNSVYCELECFRCGQACRMEVQTYLGLRSQFRYGIGDKYRWTSRRPTKHGGRPAHGNCTGEGYVVCPRCDRDFFARIEIREDRIKSVASDLTRRPYSPDLTLQKEVSCPRCGQRAERDVDLILCRAFGSPTYRLLTWREQRDQGHPALGTRHAEGRIFCESCEKWAYLKVGIRYGRRHGEIKIISTEPDVGPPSDY